jgi:hypothetical protein
MNNLILSKTIGNKLSHEPSKTSVAITNFAQRMFVTDGQTDGFSITLNEKLQSHVRKNIIIAPICL